MRLTQQIALVIAQANGIDLERDFFTLSENEVDSVIEAANGWQYRKPRNANGSRARYFFAYLQRAANKES